MGHKSVTFAQDVVRDIDGVDDNVHNDACLPVQLHVCLLKVRSNRKQLRLHGSPTPDDRYTNS